MGKCFERENIFPIIIRVISEICHEKKAGTFTAAKSEPNGRDPEYALHHEIVERLMQDGVAKTELAAARHRCQNKTEEWLAGNMVAWWSQTITEGNNPWGDGFERKKDKNNQWAYKPRSAS